MRSTKLDPIAGRPGWVQTSPGGDPTNGFRYVTNIPVCANISRTKTRATSRRSSD